MEFGTASFLISTEWD